MVAILVTAFGVREKTRDIESAKIPAFKAVIATFRNKPFMWLMGCFLLTSLSFTLLTALLPYYLTYQLEMTKE
jgi:Na+/melibiose symporter-like transporter